MTVMALRKCNATAAGKEKDKPKTRAQELKEEVEGALIDPEAK